MIESTTHFRSTSTKYALKLTVHTRKSGSAYCSLQTSKAREDFGKTLCNCHNNEMNVNEQVTVAQWGILTWHKTI